MRCFNETSVKIKNPFTRPNISPVLELWFCFSHMFSQLFKKQLKRELWHVTLCPKSLKLVTMSKSANKIEMTITCKKFPYETKGVKHEEILSFLLLCCKIGNPRVLQHSEPLLEYFGYLNQKNRKQVLPVTRITTL